MHAQSGISRREGFTLVELMVVVAIISILMAILIPGLLRARIAANETSCIGTIKTLATAQEQFKSTAVVDADGNGSGEYGYLMELAGVVPHRTTGCGLSATPISPSFLSSQIGQSALTSPINVANKSGYHLRVFLPEGEGVPSNGVPEADPLPCDPNYGSQQEQRWVVYGWPAAIRVSGNSVFYGDRRGEIFFAPNTTGPQYSGENNPVNNGNAALDAADTNLNGTPPGFPTPSQDLQIWSPAQ